MLLLSRKIGESVVIAKDIYCRILSIDKNIVTLGFDAPRIVSIHREEIHRRIEAYELMDDTIVDLLLAPLTLEKTAVPTAH